MEPLLQTINFIGSLASDTQKAAAYL